MRAVHAPVKNVPFFLKKITPKFVTEAVMLAEANIALDQRDSCAVDLLQLPRPVEARILYELFGTVRVATIVPDKSGTKKDSVRFSGKFKAYTPPNAQGEQYIFESGQTFIPVVDDLLYSTLKSAQESEPGAYLEMAFSIAIRQADPNKPSMTGYEWDVQKLITQQPTPDDPIERLRAEAKAQQLRLAAPKPEDVVNPSPPVETLSSSTNGTSAASTGDSVSATNEPVHASDSKKAHKGRHPNS